MTTYLTRFFKRLIQHEGGYSNHPHDRGGKTMWGITEAVARANGYVGDMRKLPIEIAAEISKKKYWNKVHADAFEPAVAYQLLDAAYNHGTGNAIRFLQRAAGVADDGIIGNITLTAVREMNTADVVLRFNAERLEFYTRLSTWRSFGRGWTRRIAGNLRYAAQDIPDTQPTKFQTSTNQLNR